MSLSYKIKPLATCLYILFYIYIFYYIYVYICILGSGKAAPQSVPSARHSFTLNLTAEMGRNEEVYRVLGESDENGRG